MIWPHVRIMSNTAFGRPQHHQYRAKGESPSFRPYAASPSPMTTAASQATSSSSSSSGGVPSLQMAHRQFVASAPTAAVKALSPPLRGTATAATTSPRPSAMSPRQQSESPVMSPAADVATADQPSYPCGICRQEVTDDDEAILCERGCERWFHRMCTGLTQRAYDLLTAESQAEWVCDTCISGKSIPLEMERCAAEEIRVDDGS